MVKFLLKLFRRELKITDLQYVGGSSLDDLITFHRLWKTGKLRKDEYENYYAVVRLKDNFNG